MTDQSLPQQPTGRLAFDSLIMLAARVLLGILSLAVLVIIARRLGPAVQGHVAVGLAMALILLQFGSLGLVIANPAWAARSTTGVSQLVVNSVWWATSLGLVLALAAVAFRAVAPHAVPGLTWAETVLVAANAPFMLASVLLQSVLLGQGRTVAMNLADVAASLMTVAIVSAVVWLGSAGPAMALAAALSRYPIGTAIYLLLLREESLVGRPDLGLAGKMLRYSVRVYFATVAGYLLIVLDLLIVDSYLGSRQAGLYSTAVTIAQGVFLVPMSIGANLLVRVARGSRPASTGAVVGAMIVPYAVLCLGLGLSAEPLIVGIFGDAYTGSVPLLRWLLPGTFALGLAAILSYHFSGVGYPTIAIAVWFAALLLNLALNIALIPRNGTVVAPITSSVCYALVLIGLIWVFTHTGGRLRDLRPRLPPGAAGLRARWAPTA